jgi:hypothetical protein
MNFRRTAGTGVGYSLLLLALLATLYGIAAPLAFGLTPGSVFLALASLGLGFLAAAFGVYALKAVAGTALPIDVDTDRWRAVLFRGGQG